MPRDKWKLFEAIGKPYALSIIESLNESPKRYTDLRNVCPIEKTRSKRLHELKDIELIETFIRNIEKRAFIHYGLTAKGKELFNSILVYL